MKIKCFVVLLVALSITSCQKGFDSYDDCILASMKGVESDSAARIVRISCENKFPKPVNFFDQFDGQ